MDDHKICDRVNENCGPRGRLVGRYIDRRNPRVNFPVKMRVNFADSMFHSGSSRSSETGCIPTG